MAKETPNHKDKLGREMKIGDCIAFPRSNTLYIGKVVKLNPKMVGVEELNSQKRWAYSGNKYPQDCVIVDGADVTFYMLANS